MQMTIQQIRHLCQAARGMKATSSDSIAKLRIEFMQYFDVSEDVPEDVLRVAATVMELMPANGLTYKEWDGTIKGVVLGAWMMQEFRSNSVIVP